MRLTHAVETVGPMSYPDVLRQPPAIWQQVECWLQGYWPSRVRSVTRTMAGDPLKHPWLTPQMIEPLEALDAPVRRLFALAAIAAREQTYALTDDGRRAVREAAARLAALWTTDSIYPDEQAALAAMRAALTDDGSVR